MKLIQKIIGIAMLLLSLFLWDVTEHLLTLATMEDTVKAGIAPFILFAVFLIATRQNVFK